MKLVTLASLVLVLGSCSLPPKFHDGGSPRGFKPTPEAANDWVDLRVNQATEIMGYGPVLYPGVSALGTAGRWYAMDIKVRVSLKRKTESGTLYGGELTDPVELQLFVQFADGPDGEDADRVAMPLHRELPPQTFSYANPEIVHPDPDDPNVWTIEEIQASGDPNLLAMLKSFTPPPLDLAGDLIRINPPFRSGEAREFVLRRYFFSYAPVNTRLALRVRIDPRNTVHPEHDGYISTASPGYLSPDWIAPSPTNPTPAPANNERLFEFVLR